MQQIFILVNGEQQGPFSADQIKGYLAMGHFHHEDMAWHEGLPEWKPLGQFPEFAPRAHRTPNYSKVPIRKIAQRKAGKGKGILTTVVFLLALGGVGAGGYYFWRQHQKSVAAAAAASAPPVSAYVSGAPGIPKTPAELNAWYQEPPPDQNAAALFQQGFDALQIADTDRNSTSLPLFGKAPLPQPGYPMSATMKTTVRGFLERNQPALDLFQRGAQLSGSRYAVDLSQGYATLLTHLPKVKQAVQLAALDGLWQADSRNGTNAARAARLTLASAQTLKAEPLLISQLVRVAGLAIASDTLEQALNRAALPPESLTELQSEFNRAADAEAAGEAFSRTLVGERINDLALLDQPGDKLNAMLAQASASAGSNNSAGASEKIPSNLKEQRQFIEDTLNQVLAARLESLPGRLKADQLATSRADEAKSRQFALAAMALPALGKVTSKEAVGLARLRLAQTAIALERFRAANKHFPDALTELAPKFLSAAPVDPFDGQPLRYRKAGEGYLIYSVGVDLKDDGGVRKPGSDDQSFVVLRPPKPT